MKSILTLAILFLSASSAQAKDLTDKDLAEKIHQIHVNVMASAGAGEFGKVSFTDLQQSLLDAQFKAEMFCLPKKVKVFKISETSEGPLKGFLTFNCKDLKESDWVPHLQNPEATPVEPKLL